MSFRATAIIVVAGIAGCAHAIRPFPLAEPMTLDTDNRPYGPIPDEYYSPFAWDGADQMFFRPVARFFAVDPAGEAVNVNAIDEVPDSSWFVNRLSRRHHSTEEIVAAACSEAPIDPAGPWTVVAAKPNGANPGFIIEDAQERRYLLKFDTAGEQPERATAADVMGSIIFWAAGYNTPCNRIVFFEKDILQIGEGVTVDTLNGERPLTFEDLEPVWEKALFLDDGRVRGAASRFLPGRPIGPWRYEGTRDDDPNDVIDHEDRRELRGAYVLSAWVNHFDSREQNTLAIWHATDATNGYVEHYYIDFGEIVGSRWSIEGISRRLGHSGYFEAKHVFGDLFTFGLVPRPWNQARFGPAGIVLGYFDSHRFEPDDWHPGYPNPAFLRASERDKAWMARILADFRPEEIRATIAQGHFSRPIVERELYRILVQRRRKILERYFQTLSPLTHSSVHGSQLCMRDLIISSGLMEADERPYQTRTWSLDDDEFHTEPAGSLTRRGSDSVCVTLPDLDVSDGEPRYFVVDLTGLADGLDERSMPARNHLYRLADGSYRVVGLQRPGSRDAP